MSPTDSAALIGVAVYFLMRVIDAMLPRGRHFKFVERWTEEDKEES